MVSALSARTGAPTFRRVIALIGRHGRDERAAAAWARFAAVAGAPDVSMVTVVDVYQVARRGTKAVVTIHGLGRRRDAWLWWDRVAVGSMLVVRFAIGYGPHTNREDVLYIGSRDSGSGICARISAKTVEHARRHFDRTNTV